MKALLGSTLLAESDDTVIIEGNHYFPEASLEKEYFIDSDTKTRCFWKGEAAYYTLKAADSEVVDGAWYYPNPSPAAQEIKNHVAFGSGIIVTE